MTPISHSPRAWRALAAGVLLLSALLAGCKGAQPPAPTDSASPQGTPMDTTAAGPSATPDDALQSILKPGMAYADFRKAVLAHGWSPLPDPDCKANVVGADYAQQCAADPAACKVCEDMPELSSYSEDAHALVRFGNGAGQVLEATAYGELRDWDVAGDDSTLQLSRWSVQPGK